MSQDDRIDTRPGDLVVSDREVFANHMALIASMTREFSNSRDSQAVSRHGLARITTFLGAEASSLFLLSDDGRDLYCAACFGPVDVTGMRVPLGQGIVGRAVKRNATQMVRDARHDPDFGGHDIADETGFITKSVLVAPLSLGKERLGAIEIINKVGGDGLFDAHDQTLLEVLAGSAALAIDNFRLTQRLVEQERARYELSLAAEIQRSLLPRDAEDSYPLHGINAAARLVSGDFFDIVDSGHDERIWFSIGDVSGKGMNAAILMTKTASLFRCLCKTVENPGRLLAAINAELCETGSHGMFVTMVAGFLEPATGRVVLANAGHEPPLVLPDTPDGPISDIPAEAPPLGIAPDIAGPRGYPETELFLGAGSLYLFTDGLTEAYTHLDGKQVLGTDGVRDLIREVSSRPAAQRLTAMLDSVTVPGRPLRDDVTILLVQGVPGTTAKTIDTVPPPPARAATAAVDASLLARLRVPAQSSSLRIIRHTVREAAVVAGAVSAWVDDLVMAVDEACQNVVRHAYANSDPGDMVVVVRRHAPEDDGLTVDILDFAPAVDPARIKGRDLDDVRPGGLGVYLIHAVCEEAGFRPPPEGAGNLFRLVKHFAKPPEAR